MPLKSSYKRTTNRKKGPGMSRSKGKKTPGLGTGRLGGMSSKKRKKRRGR